MREALRFAFTSRGDAVWGRLWSATAVAPTPLVLVAPRVGASMHAPAVVALCAALAEAGFAAAAVDLPLQGERASRKLSARFAACAARPERAGAGLLLWQELLRQAEHVRAFCRVEEGEALAPILRFLRERLAGEA